MNSVRLRPSLAGASPAMRWHGRPGDRRRAWTIAVSLLLHALVIAALLNLPRREPGETTTAPSYELMFEGGQGTPAPTPPADTAPPSAPAPAPDLPEASPAAPPPPPSLPESEVLPGPSSPAPEAPPDTAAPEQPPPAAAEPKPEPPPMPVEPLPVPLPPPPVAAPPVAAPPVAAPPAPAPPAEVPDVQAPPAETAPPAPQPPAVRLDLPETPAPPPPPMPDVATTAPTSPAPRAPPPRPRPHTAPPPGTFGNPMDLSFNSAPSRSAAPRMTAPRGSVASRSLDLSPGVPKGPDRTDMAFDARAARIGGDWREALKTYWVNHRYYPRQAAENGEDGSVDVELTVGGNGRVQSVVLKSHSGSPFIDMAAVGTWRNAQLPPLPPELSNPYTFTITINYILIR